MQPFQTMTGIVAPLNRSNVDTDAIMPKQYLKSIKRTGFGPYVFDEWRYLDKGEPGIDCSDRPINPDFELNQPQYQGARILLTQENFGCGSSREHAPWGLKECGFKVIIAPSFAEIFYNNCIKNGILPIELSHEIVNHLFELTYQNHGLALTVDLERQIIFSLNNQQIEFDIDLDLKQRLLEGMDDIELTLQYAADIKLYEEESAQKWPWLYQSLDLDSDLQSK